MSGLWICAIGYNIDYFIFKSIIYVWISCVCAGLLSFFFIFLAKLIVLLLELF